MINSITPPIEFAPDEQLNKLQFDFTGEWLPDLHSLKIGNGNYSDCQNIRYTRTGLITPNGYTKINKDTAIETYIKGRNGFQLRTPNTQKSYIFAQYWNTELTASKLFIHKGTPPETSDFEAIALYTDNSEAGIGYFIEGPTNDMVYCNSIETLIYGGEESAIAAFVLATSVTNLTITNPIIYTKEILNTLNSVGHTVAIAAASNVYLVGASRPLCGIKPYVLVANGAVSTVTIAEWGGTAWSNCTLTSDGTIVSGKTHAQSGMILFDSTVTTSKPAYITDNLLYWYKITLSAGTCTLYHCTVNAPIQGLIDLWDGINRINIQCEISRAGIYEDYTPEVYGSSTIQYPIAAKFSGIASSDHVILMFEDRTTAVKYNFLAGLLNTLLSTVTVNYWNGSAWVSVGTVYDGTLNTANTISMNQNGTIYWNPPSETIEHKVNLFNTYGYAYQFIWSGGLSAHTKRPIEAMTKAAECSIQWVGHGFGYADKVKFEDITQAGWTALNGESYEITIIDSDNFTIAVDTSAYAADYVPGTDPGTIYSVSSHVIDGCYPDTIYGIPAPKIMQTYRFAFNYKNRVFLAGNVAAKEGHRIDYGVKDTSDSYNGSDSSANGQQLYIGKNSSDVLAAANVFNRFGASIYNSELILKEAELYLLDGDTPETFVVSQISENIGIAAPRTLSTAEVAFEVTKDAIRNIAMWVSNVGPVIFDAAVIVPLPGINLYFDSTKDTCVNFAALENAHGWFDPNYYEWNICLPSGTNQTKCNVWVVYDLINKKWSKRNTGIKEIPQATIRVIDDNGNIYFYGLLDTGYMVRLEHGSLWDSLLSIESFVVTNDMLPTGSIFDVTAIHNLKFLCDSVGGYTIKYTRTDIEVKGSGIESGDLRIYGRLIEDSTVTASYWDGEDFVCKQLITNAIVETGKWSEDTGVVSIIGDVYENWSMEITTVSGNFIVEGFLEGLTILTSDTETPGPFLCTDIEAKKMTFSSGKAVDFQPNASITLSTLTTMVLHSVDGLDTETIVPFNDLVLSARYITLSSSCNLIGITHRFKFLFYSAATESNIKPLAWGIYSSLQRLTI